MKDSRMVLAGMLGTFAMTAIASTLHGRVKDQQCSVLGKIAVRIRALDTAQDRVGRELATDDGGNYNVELIPGTYEVCFSPTSAKRTCTRIDMPATGDKWITTQLRDAAPDLSNLGNHAN